MKAYLSEKYISVCCHSYAMAVVKKGGKPPVEGQADPLADLQWEEAPATAYKVNVGDEIVFVPLSDLRSVKRGGAWVLDAYVLRWKRADGELREQRLTLFVQTILASRVQQAIARYGVGNVVIWAKNLGRQQGVRYYMYDVKYAKWEQGSDKSG